MKTKRIITVVAALSILVLIAAWGFHQLFLKKDTIHIAMVGPMTGESAAVGKSFRQGVLLYLDMINQKGGVNEKEIVLDVYDDQNDPKRARAMATKIKNEDRAVAVIGHHYSTCSISAGKIYKTFSIPAISPASTNVRVTENNEWYFRSSFNDRLQGRFLANYAYQVLGKETFSIIHEDDEYGAYLAGVFEDAAREKGVQIKYKWEFKLNDKYLDQELKQIVDDLSYTQDAGVIFLATHSNEGVKLIRLMKDMDLDNPIIAPDAFASETFQNAFAEFPRERKNPGFYTDGLYVTTPLIFDTTNEKGLRFKESYEDRYGGEEPGWHAAFAYDTAMVLVEAIRGTNIQGRPRTIGKDRQKIRDWLAKRNNIYEAIEGVTGYNFFDEQGDSQKAIFMGTYKNQKLISALTQFRTIPNTYEVPNYDQKVRNGQIVTFDDKPSYKINVVYTGIKINEIKELDTKDFSYVLDFYLWFRYQGDLKVHEIEFLNATEPIALMDPSHLPLPDKDPETREGEKTTPHGTMSTGENPKTAKTPEGDGSLNPSQTITTDGDLNYRLYHIQKKFRGDFLSNLHVFGQHILGLSLRPRALDRNSLILVKDVLGMRLKNDQSLLERMGRDQVLSSGYGWKMSEILFFQDVAEKELLGNPEHFNVRGGTLEYSRFNMGIRIVKDRITLRGVIPNKLSVWLLFPSLIFTIFLGSLANKRNRRLDELRLDDKGKKWSERGESKEEREERQKDIKFLQIILLLQVLFCALLLLSAEVFVLYELSEQLDRKLFRIVVITFDIAWWLVGAFFASVVMKRFVWTPVEEKTRQPIPKIVRGLVILLLFILAAMAIVAFVFDQKLTSLLATSGVIAMIVGLAIQINIANIFSGIAINIERPFKIDDWVQIGNFKEGKVTDINWRTTRLKTRDDTILNIPNSQASESPIENFSMPEKGYWKYFTIHVDARHPPDRVKKVLLDAALSTPGVLKEPYPPGTRFLGLTAGMTGQSESWAANYLIGVYVNDYGSKFAHNEAVWLNVWTHLKHAGIKHVIERKEVHMTLRKPKKEKLPKPLAILHDVYIFNPFSDESKVYLSERMKSIHFRPEETVVRQGDEGDSLFIIEEGTLSVKVSMNGKETEVARLGTGNFFGERALLTGEPRTATIESITDTRLYEITKKDIFPLLEQQPKIMREIGTVLGKREADNKLTLASQQEREEAEKNFAAEFLGKIQGFFGIK